MKKLDFNALEKPVLELTLKDEAKTVVRATAPTEELVERLTAAAGELKEVMDKGNSEAIRAMFELIADLMSCNLDNLTFTAEELRDKYNMKLYDAAVFVKVYLEFIQELNSAKN